MTDFLVLAFAPVPAGVAVGYARGGRLSGLAGRLRALWLLWLAAAVQAAQFYLDGWRSVVEDRLGIPLPAVVFGIVALWLAVNLAGWSRAMRLAAGVVLAGALLNGIAIAANGRMPYSPETAARAGVTASGATPKNEPASGGTRFEVLGDVIAVPPLHKVISVGDVLIGVGAALLIAAAMRRDDRAEHDSKGGES